VKIGDMLLNDFGETAILLSEPRLLDEPANHLDPDCGPYYVAEVFLTEFGRKEVWITDDLEIISEGR